MQARLSAELGVDGTMAAVSDAAEAFRELSHKDVDQKVRCRMPSSSLSVEYRNMRALNGRIRPTFSKVADGSIITLFDKTPYPVEPQDVVCPHFVELKWANGCNFDCAWCYLNGTLRFRPDGKAPYLKDPEKIEGHIRSYLEQTRGPSLLNSGELSDSLAFEGNGGALSKTIIPLFKGQDRHKLLVLTKSANMKGIAASESQDNVIVSFSLNSFKVAKRWERKAPTPKQRIQAAKKLARLGYTVRVRIDPIVPVEGWEQDYRELVDHLFANIVPERITIGSLRGLQSTINRSPDRSWVDYLDENSNWGKKISFAKRVSMYRSIIGHLENEYGYSDVGLCKETVEMWRELGMKYRGIKCNCML